MTHAVEIPALDGRNPLGFLAALGLLNLLGRVGTGPVSLAFSDTSGVAVLHSELATMEDMIDALGDIVASAEVSTSIPGISAAFPLRAGKNADPMRQPREKYRELVARVTAIDVDAADQWLPYLITDLAVDKQGRADITPFNAPSGKQNLRTFFSKPFAEVRSNRERLREALTGWRRLEDFTGEYFDHRVINSAADDPQGKSAERGVPGATWLATMAFPLLRVTGDGQNIAATLWHRVDRRFLMIWPLWRRPLDKFAVRVLLEHRCLIPIDAKPTVKQTSWPALDIFGVYGAERQLVPPRKFAGVLAPITVTVSS
jgi:hypothetical protein